MWRRSKGWAARRRRRTVGAQGLQGVRAFPPPEAGRQAPAARTHYFEPPRRERAARGRTRRRQRSAEFRRTEAPPPGHRRSRRIAGRRLPPPPPPYDETRKTSTPAAAPLGPPRRHRGAMLVIAGIAGAGYWQRHTIAGMVASFRSRAARRRRNRRRRRPPRARRSPTAWQSRARRSTQDRHRAGRRGGAEGGALRRGAEQSEGQTLGRFGDLAHRNGLARLGAGARTGRARRRRDSRAPHAHDLLAPPQHRQGAAGEPHHRDPVHAAGRFPRGRHRQRAGHLDEAERDRRAAFRSPASRSR